MAGRTRGRAAVKRPVALALVLVNYYHSASTAGTPHEPASWCRESIGCPPSYAAFRLAELLAEAGNLDELRARAGAGDGPAALRLAERGDQDERGEDPEWLLGRAVTFGIAGQPARAARSWARL